jgi:hypothetical protein
MAYGGHRQYLDTTNYLRSFGQSKACCPPNFYTSYNQYAYSDLVYCNSDNYNNSDRNVQTLALDEMTSAENQEPSGKYVYGQLCTENATKKRTIISFLNGNKSVFSFEHGFQFDKRLFDTYLYYSTCDYRISERPNRSLSSNDYYTFAELAQEVNESYTKIRKKRATVAALIDTAKKNGHKELTAILTGLKESKEEKVPILVFEYKSPKLNKRILRANFNGQLFSIEGFCAVSYFHKLRFPFTDTVRFGPWHGLVNITKNLLWGMNGSDRLHKKTVADFCEVQQSHPYTIKEKKNPHLQQMLLDGKLPLKLKILSMR